LKQSNTSKVDSESNTESSVHSLGFRAKQKFVIPVFFLNQPFKRVKAWTQKKQDFVLL